MADKESKNSTPDEQETGGAVKVGDGGQAVTVRRLREPGISIKTRNKKPVLIGLLVIVVVIIGAVIVSRVTHVGEKVYAQAASHKVYKKEVDALIKGSQGVTVKNAATVLANKYLYQKMLKDEGLSVTSDDVVKQYPDINSKNTSAFMRQYDTNDVYVSTLVAYNAGLYKGKVLATNFSLHILSAYPVLAAEQKSLDPKAGNAEAVAQDKQYAYSLINSLYEQIKSKKISFDQAIKTEFDDPRVGANAYPTLLHSGSFDTSNPGLPDNSLLAPKSIQKRVASIKPGELTKPFVVRVATSTNPKDTSTVESYWLVIQMSSSHGSHNGMSYDQYLTQAKKKLDYKVNV